MLVYNGLGKPVLNMQIEILGCDNYVDGASYASGNAISQMQTVGEGDTAMFEIYCEGPIANTKFTSDIKINYDTKTLEETLSHEQQGMISSEVGGVLLGIVNPGEGGGDADYTGPTTFDFSTGGDEWVTNGTPSFYSGSVTGCGLDVGVDSMCADQCSTTGTWNDIMWGPSIALTGMSSAMLSADVWKEDETQYGWYYDIGYIVISTDGGTTYDTLSALGYSSGWTTVEYDIDAYLGETISIGVLFNTQDGCCSFESFCITNIEVTEGEPSCDCATEADVCCPIADFSCTATGCEGYDDAGPLFGFAMSSASDWSCEWQSPIYQWNWYEYCYDGQWNAYNNCDGGYQCNNCDVTYSNCQQVYDQNWNTVCNNCACPDQPSECIMTCTASGCPDTQTGPNFGGPIKYASDWGCEWGDYGVDYEYCSGGNWYFENGDLGYYCGSCDEAGSYCSYVYELPDWNTYCNNCACPMM